MLPKRNLTVLIRVLKLHIIGFKISWIKVLT